MDERRYYGLDALRGGMMMLGIVLHAAFLYMADPPPAMPAPTDPRNHGYAFDLLFAYFFVGATLRWFDRDAPWIVYTSQASYWVFLVHMPLVCLAGWWLLRFDLPSGIKFLLVCAFAAAGSFASFHYLVQRSWLSVFLHGKRFDLAWPWQAARPRLAA